MSIDNTFDTVRSLLMHDRTVRRFDGSRPIDEATLRRLVELTRYCASGRNAQPLRYRIVTDDAERAAIYSALKWAGYYTDWDGPVAAERPAAYLVQCLDTTFGADCLCDDGLQLQAITLGATALGISGCIIKAFNAAAVADTLSLPDGMKPRYVLALGYPTERVTIDDMDGTPGADYRYWRDGNATHHVPKRPLDELIIK